MGCLASRLDDVTSLRISPRLERINRNSFLFSHLLGEGGFGTVTAARAVFIDDASISSEWFAVKEIAKSEVFKHKTGLTMLYGELNALKRLAQPYIVGLTFAFSDETSCFLVLGLLMGGDLRHYLKIGTVFEESDICFIAACLSSALEYMHSRRVLHRDVKPENIIFDACGYPYFTDFGVAYVHDESSKVFKHFFSEGNIWFYFFTFLHFV